MKEETKIAKIHFQFLLNKQDISFINFNRNKDLHDLLYSIINDHSNNGSLEITFKGSTNGIIIENNESDIMFYSFDRKSFLNIDKKDILEIEYLDFEDFKTEFKEIKPLQPGVVLNGIQGTQGFQSYHTYTWTPNGTIGPTGIVGSSGSIGITGNIGLPKTSITTTPINSPSVTDSYFYTQEAETNSFINYLKVIKKEFKCLLGHDCNSDIKESESSNE